MSGRTTCPAESFRVQTLEDNLPPRVPDDPGYPPLTYKRQFVPPKEMVADPKP
ncbi:MAG: hypothetical protein MPW16_01620 [Candidatus Manganitrophus sp.]|nr:MAG: hypothetical protein MPW16_01620 [Candidatus Manganitrophus sp.]